MEVSVVTLCVSYCRRGVFFSAREFKETIYNQESIAEMPEQERNRLSLNKSVSSLPLPLCSLPLPLPSLPLSLSLLLTFFSIYLYLPLLLFAYVSASLSPSPCSICSVDLYLLLPLSLSTPINPPLHYPFSWSASLTIVSPALRENPEDGPWLVSVESVSSYRPVLSYCSDRDLRKSVWTNLVTLGSVKYAASGYSNKQAIDGVRFARWVAV